MSGPTTQEEIFALRALLSRIGTPAEHPDDGIQVLLKVPRLLNDLEVTRGLLVRGLTSRNVKGHEWISDLETDLPVRNTRAWMCQWRGAYWHEFGEVQEHHSVECWFSSTRSYLQQANARPGA